ncbi:hypothetical protein QIS99_25480 [Streptomyces sp. B-S-A8]|uniref:CBS domain-containing protein n=1 Tax=Streptomyces solicavernae TaxID=3043614 RepID=A0ABT6RYK8_9ACTN|nr:CBS domain-containing protein [Streptomyces sp. B-S-A8]MDI3389519.1 hypothetical protein [Streptomyces sp. B-S-A8]
MRPTDPLAQHADHDIAVLPADLTPADAKALLTGTGVVVADDGGVLGTVTAADLADADADAEILADLRGLPSVIAVDADLTLVDLINSPAVTLLLLGIPRLVLLRARTPVAVLAVSRLTDYLASGEHPLPDNEMGPMGASADSALPGRVRLPRAQVACAECGHRNALDHWNPRRPPRCANPEGPAHDLTLEG